MRRWTYPLCLALLVPLALTGSAWSDEGILTPDAAGAATGSMYFPLQYAFDAQPTWDSQYNEPDGDGSGGNDAPYYQNRHGYIDFGEDYADVRITQLWTLYRPWSGGDQIGYADAWWDDDKDTTNDDGVVEYDVYFNSAQGVSNVNYVQWIIDMDATSDPIVPQRRYLILHAASGMTNRAREYAIVGYIQVNETPEVDAGSDDSILWPEDEVSLDATVSDDGLPDPPASLDILWTKTSGPGTVTFDDDEAVDTDATFSEPGTYVLRLTVDDGEFEEYDEITITVQEQYMLPPADAGAATGSAYFPLQNAFDGGAYWDDQAEEPGGGEAGNDAPAYAGRYGYIDFGPDWEDVRITQCWTLYRSWSGGNQTPYVAAWWDDDKDTTNDDGVAEYDINFNSAQGLSNIGSTQWAIDLDTISSPITPQRRFLILQAPATMTNRAKEYGIVGWYTTGRPANVPPTVDAGDYQEITWPTYQVSLDATVTDDGQPDPQTGFTVEWTKESGPGTVTFGDDEAVDTTASFSTTGTYVLRLTADDGELDDYDEVTITVTPSSITTPTLSLPGPQVFNYGSLVLVDEVICGDAQDPHTLYESSTSVSSISTVLGSSCRVMANTGSEPKYFSYILGEDCDLEAGAAYILVVEYPEDQPRSMIVANQGCETYHGFHTGTTTGDCMTPLYVGTSNPESMHYGLTGDYEKFEQLFWLHDRFPGIQRPRGEGSRPYLPEDGFHVTIAQFRPDEDPLSAGAAVKRIALYEAPSLASITQQLNLPEGLPKRHLFWREEMADGVIGSSTETLRGVAEDVDWYEYKARLHKFLGMNTFCKDLLEFGHCQGWDVSYYDDSNGTWYNRSSTPFRWEEILMMLVDGEYGLDVLPYYEYAGGDGTGPQAIGRDNRCITLAGTTAYTHISWSESLSIDVTDSEGLTDAQRTLEQSMLVYADGGFPKAIPVSGYSTETWNAGEWGYVDFGPDYDDVRIRQCWTRSRMWHGGTATPYPELYWHDDYTEFSGGEVPQDAVEEETINFITQTQINTAPRWSKDVDLTAPNAITPSARYLVMHTPDPIRDCMEYLFVGTIDGQGTDLGVISVAGAGSVNGFGMDDLFDNQPEYNTEPTEFVGAWIRNRTSMIPISFSDDILEIFGDEEYEGATITRTDLQTDPFLLEDYYEWWYPKRKVFIDALASYLQSNGITDAMLLYTPDSSESGVTHPSLAPDIVTDDTATWAGLDEMHIDEALAIDLQYEALVLDRYTWSYWEWHHSVPHHDPWNFTADDDAKMTFSFNNLYTVSEPWALSQFEGDDDGIAAVRHYCLNESDMTNSSETELLGYFVADVELAGPYCTLPEARMVAYGNPYYIGYLAGNSFTRGFPGYAREFNANFLALPALAMDTEVGAASTDDVVVRSIETANDGTWLAIVNVSLEDQEDVVITLPVSGTVTDAVTGSAISVSNGTITLDLWPGQLKSVHIDD